MLVRLTVTEGPHKGDAFTFEQHDSVLVGRSKKAHFRLLQKDDTLSRIHFLAEFNPPFCRLMDMGSTNGTEVNGELIKTADLKDGDLIRAGLTVIRVDIRGDARDPEPAPEGPSELSELATRLIGRLPDGFDGGLAVGLGSELAPAAQPPTPDVDETPAWAFVDETPAWPGPPPSVTPTPRTTSLPTGFPSSIVTHTEPAGSGHETEVVPIVGITPRPPAIATCPICAAPSDPRPFRPSLARPLCLECRELVEGQSQPIPDYLLVREIGRGGMGTVYHAVRVADASVVAIKTVIPAIAGTDAQIQRFLREASILKSLDHPNIVAFHEVGEAGGLLYFAMEYIPGIDAARWYKANPGTLPINRAVALTCHLLKALEHAHAQGFVHRDIKPSNILIARGEGGGRGKLADFGLARVYQSSKLSGLTMMNDVGGTVAYSAPEQITHFRDTKPPADQYAAAVTLYVFLTGETPFPRVPTLQQQILQLLDRAPTEIRTLRPDVPEPLARAIHRALEKDPAKRYPSVADFRTAIQPFTRPG